MTGKGSLLIGTSGVMSPSPAVSTEISSDAVANRRDTMSGQQKRETERREQQAHWIQDQIERDIAVHGAGPKVLSVTPSFSSYIVRFLQWQPSDLAGEVSHDFILPRGRNPESETVLREEASRRFSKLLAWQAQRCAELGPPRKIDATDVDLSRFTIDAPLAAMLQDAYQRPGEHIRQMLVSPPHALLPPEPIWESAHVITDLSMSVAKRHIQGKFVTGNNQVMLKWSKGSLGVLGIALPDAVMLGCRGGLLQDVIQHPWLTHPMTITAVSSVRWQGTDGFTLNLRDAAAPMPNHW